MNSNEFLELVRKFIINAVLSVLFTLIYDFLVYPFISDIFAIPLSSGLLIGFIFFLCLILLSGGEFANSILQADKRELQAFLKIRAEAEEERGKLRYGTAKWREVSDKLGFYDRHIGHYERRIEKREQERQNKRGSAIPIFGINMSPKQIKWVLGSLFIFSLGGTIGAYSLISIQTEKIETLTVQVSEEGIANLIREIDEINTSYMDLRIQYEQLIEEYETLEEDNRRIAREAVEAELKVITVTGIINDLIGKDWLGVIIRTPQEIRFESPQGEVMDSDPDLNYGRYSVDLENYCTYIVKINYSTRFSTRWETVDNHFRVDSDVTVFPKDW